MQIKNKNLLFDLDGTLTDPKEGITKSFIYALEKLGVVAPTADELEWCIGPPLHDSFFKMLNDKSETLKAVDLYRERYNKIGMYENIVYDNIHEVLSELKTRGHELFLATSKLKSCADKIIDHFEFRKYFAAVHGSEASGVRSDKAELIAYLLEQEALAPENCIMIGDREYDVIGASKNNMMCIGVEWGYGSNQELTKAGATYLVKSPGDLMKLKI